MRGHDAMTLNVCTDCVQHLANGLCGTCHTRPEGWSEDGPCPVGLRMGRKWGDVAITLGTTEPCSEWCGDPEGDTCTWFSMSDCEGCGDTDGGGREHATAWIARTRVVAEHRTLRPDGSTLVIQARADRSVRLVLRRHGQATRSTTCAGIHLTGAARYGQAATWLHAA